MIRHYSCRLNDWFNTRGKRTQILLYFGFCLVFLCLLVLSICYVHFDGQIQPIPVPQHIGRPSGPVFKDSLTIKKH